MLTVEGLETYLLFPRDHSDWDLLIEAVRAAPSPMDLDVVIGTRGKIAPPELCNGLMVPTVAFDQIYSFERDALIQAIPKPEQLSAEAFAPAASDLFDRIMRLADNAGGTDEHRALNVPCGPIPGHLCKCRRSLWARFFPDRSRDPIIASQRNTKSC